jgi:hypothetical protein
VPGRTADGNLADVPIPSPSSRRPLAGLIDLQDSVTNRAQLRELGYDDDAVRAQIAANRWQRHGRDVVVLHNGPVSVNQRRWIAVLAQHRAALAGLTAAHKHGLTGFEDATVHVVIPHGARPQPLPGVRLHISRGFGAADLHPGRSLPTVRAERALVDAASWTAPPRRACAILAAGVHQRLTTADRLQAELSSGSPGRHHRLLSLVVGDIAGGADSFAEIDFGRLTHRAGLAPPRRQAFRLDSGGRRRFLDADLGGFFVEIDGAIHLRAMRYWDDMERQNDLLIVTGKPILRFASVAVRIAPDAVMVQLRSAAARFGNS